GSAHNMGVLWEYLENNGRMVDVYTDRDSMFAVPPRPGESPEEQRQADRLTQLGRFHVQRVDFRESEVSGDQRRVIRSEPATPRSRGSGVFERGNPLKFSIGETQPVNSMPAASRWDPRLWRPNSRRRFPSRPRSWAPR